jgi:hypothetical protein
MLRVEPVAGCAEPEFPGTMIFAQALIFRLASPMSKFADVIVCLALERALADSPWRMTSIR